MIKINNLEFNQFIFWSNLKISNLLLALTENLTKLIVILQNELELKTTNWNLEAIIWIVKYSSLINCEQLIEMTILDNIQYEKRFKLVYILRSLFYSNQLIVSFLTFPVNGFVSSIVYLYRSAGWLEREIWDMFGLKFKNNFDLRRILTDYGFNGHPLRKEFPLTGFYEVYYSDPIKKLTNTNVELTQEFRNFYSNLVFIKNISNLFWILAFWLLF